MPDSMLTNALRLLDSAGGHNAYSRYDKLPIDILPKRSGDEVSGGYYPDDSWGARKISIDYPKGSDPNEIQDVLKHELVHHAITQGGDKIPQPIDYADKFDSPPNAKYTNLFDALGSPAKKNVPAPWNMWNYGGNGNTSSWGRAGEATEELPAYMSIFEPDKVPVQKATRDLYLKNLFKWLTDNGKGDVAAKIMHLMQGRQAYTNVGEMK